PADLIHGFRKRLLADPAGGNSRMHSFHDFPHLVRPTEIKTGCAAYTNDLGDVRLKLANQLDRAFNVEVANNAGRVGRQRQLLQLSLIRCTENDRRSRKELCAVGKDKLQREPSNRHNEIDLSPGVTILQVAEQNRLLLISGETCEIEVFRKQLNWRGEGTVKNLARVLFDSLNYRPLRE